MTITRIRVKHRDLLLQVVLLIFGISACVYAEDLDLPDVLVKLVEYGKYEADYVRNSQEGKRLIELATEDMQEVFKYAAETYHVYLKEDDRGKAGIIFSIMMRLGIYVEDRAGIRTIAGLAFGADRDLSRLALQATSSTLVALAKEDPLLPARLCYEAAMADDGILLEVYGQYDPSGAMRGIALVADMEESDRQKFNRESLRTEKLIAEFRRSREITPSQELQDQLAELTSSESWIRRYYVAALLRSDLNRQLRIPEIVDSLTVDESVVIRRVMNRIPPYAKYRATKEELTRGTPEERQKRMEKIRYLESQGEFEALKRQN